MPVITDKNRIFCWRTIDFCKKFVQNIRGSFMSAVMFQKGDFRIGSEGVLSDIRFVNIPPVRTVSGKKIGKQEKTA